MQLLDGKKLKLGTCYYPEHWPEKLWEDDLKRMLDAGIEVIRIAEFAWSKVEPKEGEFTYDFFDRFLDLCEKVGMYVIFCTPTATPPAWLTKKYPEVLNCDINGVSFHHGSRRHYNYSSEKYIEKSEIITREFASHYGKRKCIIGWQLDNEFNCEVNEFYSEADTAAFRVWLLNKYHDIDSLNEAWGTAFWNQTYTEWEEIFVPRRTCNGAQNPHEMLDYYRFISFATINFAKKQVDIIKQYKKPKDFITTNGLFGNLDNHEFKKECLDVYMFDCYPNFTNRVGEAVSEEDLRDRNSSRMLAETRSISPVFGIMEQQTGANGNTVMPAVPSPRPGQIKLWTLQSIAHGADYVSYFRWRTANFGTEMYWHGILDYSGRDNERLAEIKDIGALLKNLDTVAGKKYRAEVAVIKDYDNIFDAQADKWHETIDKVSQDALFNAMQKTHTPFDYVYFYGENELSADLKSYKVVFYPHPIISCKERVDALHEFVKEGGILILGARSGLKNMAGKCTTEKLPGVFAPLSGVDVKEYSFIQPDYNKVKIDMGTESLHAEMFVDRISDDPAATISGFFANEYYHGDIAVTKKTVGKGFVYYYGSAFNEESVDYFLRETGTRAPFDSIVSVPQTVEVAMRGDCLFILNYKKESADAVFKDTVTDLVTREAISGRVEIPGYGALVVKII